MPIENARDVTVNIWSPVKALIFLLLAIIPFIINYKLYQLIIELEMSNLAKFTIVIVFWLISFTVVYMGTDWTYRGVAESDR